MKGNFPNYIDLIQNTVIQVDNDNNNEYRPMGYMQFN